MMHVATGSGPKGGSPKRTRHGSLCMDAGPPSTAVKVPDAGGSGELAKGSDDEAMASGFSLCQLVIARYSMLIMDGNSC